MLGDRNVYTKMRTRSIILIPIKNIWNKFHGKIIHIIYSQQSVWLINVICIHSLISDSESSEIKEVII